MGKIIRTILIVIAVVFILLFALVWFGIIAGASFMAPFLTNFFPGQEMLSIILMINLLFFIGLPLVTVVIGVSRLAFKTRMGKGWRTGMLLLWIINTVSFFAIGGTLAREFAVEREMKQDLTTADFEADTVKIGFYEVEKVEGQTFRFGPGESIELPGARTYISVRPSEDGAWRLEQTTSSRGGSIDEAEDLARSLDVPLRMEAGSILIPEEVPFGEIPKWRNQEVHLTLYAPEGALFRFDQQAAGRAHRMHMKGEHRLWRYPNEVYRMEKEGLACVTCPVEEVEEESSATGEGQLFPFTDFNKLNISGMMKVEIVHGDQFEVRLAGDQQYLEQVEMNVDGQDFSVQSGLERPGSPIRLFVTMPSLDRLEASGTDDISIKGFEQGEMTITATGDFEIKSDLRADRLLLTLADEADYELTGNIGLLEATLSDRARLDTDRGVVSSAKLTLADESRAKMKQGVEILEQTVGEDSRIRLVD